jgi:site-specific recombinase XerD
MLDETKYLTLREVRKLKRAAAARKDTAQGTPGEPVAVRDWFLVNLVLGSGLRVQEAASLDCGDVLLGQAFSRILVRQGKTGLGLN